MLLVFLGSFRRCSVNSTQHFKILGTIDSERGVRLQSYRLVTNGVISFYQKEHPEPLRERLAIAMRTEHDVMTQMGLLCEVTPVHPDGQGMEFSMERLSVSSD